jgi:hypothetical protein
MTALNYDANKLPLGKLSKGTIARGFQALKDLSVLIDNTDATSMSEVERLSNQYFSIIPHAFGRNRPPIIRDINLLKKEVELLESLSDMKETAAMLKDQLKDKSDVNKLDKQFQGLGMNEMSPLDHKSREFVEIDEYLNNSKGKTHHVSYQVQEIFRIERQGEFERFDKSKYSKIASNRRLLWHGSRVTNYGGILGQGLRIAPPEAPATGYMFGKGIYLADMSSKSANYCNAYNSGGTALLLLCEAELGNPMHELTDASYTAGEDAIKKGMYSTFGMGETGPSKWKDAGCMNPALKGCMMVSITYSQDVDLELIVKLAGCINTAWPYQRTQRVLAVQRVHHLRCCAGQAPVLAPGPDVELSFIQLCHVSNSMHRLTAISLCFWFRRDEGRSDSMEFDQNVLFVVFFSSALSLNVVARMYLLLCTVLSRCGASHVKNQKVKKHGIFVVNQIQASQETLIAPANSPLVVVFKSGCINNLYALAQTDHVTANLPPSDSMLILLALAHRALVVCVDQATEPSTITANHDDGLTNPLAHVVDVLTVDAAQCIDYIDEFRPKVPEHVDESCGGVERHDHGWVLD